MDGVNSCFVWLEWTAKDTMVLMELIGKSIRKSILSQSQVNPRVFTQNLINSSALGSAFGYCGVSSGFQC